TGDIDVSTNKIVNVVNPTANQDAATKNYVDTTTATAEQGTTADSALQNVAEDLSPQLGGNLNVGGFAMIIGSEVVLDFASPSEFAVNNIEVQNNDTGLSPIIRSVGADTNIDLRLSPKGTGAVDVEASKIINVTDPISAQDAATKNYVDTTTATAEQGTTADTALQNVVEDLAPRLGGQLDVNDKGLGDGTNVLLDFVEDPSAVNNIQIENEATGSGPIIRSVGADTNVDLNLSSKGTGVIKLNGIKTNAFTDADESKLDGIEAGANVTDATNVNAAGAVMETDYELQTILIAVVDNTPLPITVFPSEFVGRKAAGNVGTMTVVEARTLLNVESGATADQNLWATFEADTGTTTADTTTDTLTVAGGTGISTAISADTLTVTTSALLNVADDTAPQLGGQLNVSTFGIGDTNSNLVLDFSTAGELSVNHIQIENSIAGTGPVIRSIGVDTNVDIRFSPKGTGAIDATSSQIINVVDPTDSQDVATKNYVDNNHGLDNVVDDLAPRLGGQLDVNGKGLGDGTNLLLDFVEDASAVNHIEIENEATGSGPIIRAVGSDTNVDLNIEAKGTGNVIISNLLYPNTDGNAGEALTTDGAGNLSFTEMVPVTTFTTQTTDATQTTIVSISVTSGTSLYFTIKGHGRENATGDTKGSKIEGIIENTGGTTVLVGSLHIIDIDTAGAATWDITAEANDGTDALDIKVTGEAAHTIDWKLRVETIEE
ncbi:hypothetical protein LCGC14_0891490, partial [marine sediment metagenome]